MDLFCEQIVKKNKTTIDIIKLVLIFFATIIVATAVFLLSSNYLAPIIGIILAGFVIYIGFFFISSTNCEFEYIVTNGEIDIDKIIAGRKRKRLASTSVKSFSAFGKLDENTPKFNGTIIKACDNISGNLYYAEFKHKKHGNVRLIFSPNEKTLNHIKPFIPRRITNYNNNK